jgi:hypothetical protein
MYNLLVSGRGWAPERDDMFADRLLEYTDSSWLNDSLLAARLI